MRWQLKSIVRNVKTTPRYWKSCSLLLSLTWPRLTRCLFPSLWRNSGWRVIWRSPLLLVCCLKRGMSYSCAVWMSTVVRRRMSAWRTLKRWNMSLRMLRWRAWMSVCMTVRRLRPLIRLRISPMITEVPISCDTYPSSPKSVPRFGICWWPMWIFRVSLTTWFCLTLWVWALMQILLWWI